MFNIGDKVRIYSKVHLENIGVVLEHHPPSEITGVQLDIYTVKTTVDTNYYFVEELELL